MVLTIDLPWSTHFIQWYFLLFRSLKWRSSLKMKLLTNWPAWTWTPTTPPCWSSGWLTSTQSWPASTAKLDTRCQAAICTVLGTRSLVDVDTWHWTFLTWGKQKLDYMMLKIFIPCDWTWLMVSILTIVFEILMEQRRQVCEWNFIREIICLSVFQKSVSKKGTYLNIL